MEGLKVGLKHRKSITVDPGLTVPEVSPAFGEFRDMPRVFATAYMVGFVEATCIEGMKPFLGASQGSVGVHVDMSHDAATPVGMTVTAEVELVSIEGRRLRFKVECRDGKDVIGTGFHERFVIDVPKFIARVEAKARG